MNPLVPIILRLLLEVAKQAAQASAVQKLAISAAVSLGLYLGLHFGTHDEKPSHQPAPAVPSLQELDKRFAPPVMKAEFLKPRAGSVAHIAEGESK